MKRDFPEICSEKKEVRGKGESFGHPLIPVMTEDDTGILSSMLIKRERVFTAVLDRGAVPPKSELRALSSGNPCQCQEWAEGFDSLLRQGM